MDKTMTNKTKTPEKEPEELITSVPQKTHDFVDHYELDFQAASEEQAEDAQSIEPESNLEFLPLDLAGAFDKLNQERDQMFGVTNQTNPLPLELDNESVKNYIKNNGITKFLVLIRQAMDEAGYVSYGNIEFMNKRSGVLVKF